MTDEVKCEATSRLARDKARGISTKAKDLDVVCRSCPCEKCSQLRAREGITSAYAQAYDRKDAP